MFIEQSLTDQAVRWVMNMIALLPKVFVIGVLGTMISVMIHYNRKQSNGQ